MIQPVSLILGISLINSPLTYTTTSTPKVDTNVIYTQSESYSATKDYYLTTSQPEKVSFDQEQARKAAEAEARRQEEERQKQIQAEQARILAAQRQAARNRAATPKPSRANYQPSSADRNYAHSRVVYWASHYGLDVDRVVNIAYCESGMRPNAVGGGGLYLGLFQQHSSYWPARAARAGVPGGNPLNPDHNARVSAYMMKTQGYGHWPSCGA
jgi:hypothetical protein